MSSAKTCIGCNLKNRAKIVFFFEISVIFCQKNAFIPPERQKAESGVRKIGLNSARSDSSDSSDFRFLIPPIIPIIPILPITCPAP